VSSGRGGSPLRSSWLRSRSGWPSREHLLRSTIWQSADAETIWADYFFGSGIRFVGGATSNKGGAVSGNTTIALNSGLTRGSRPAVAQDDFVLAVFASGSIADRTLSITDGTTEYTVVDTERYVDNNDDLNVRVAYKFMGSTPDTSVTFGPTGSLDDAGTMAVYVFSGVDPNNPLDVAAVVTTGTAMLANPGSITPVTKSSAIVVIGAAGFSGSFRTLVDTNELKSYFATTVNDTYDVTIGIGHRLSYPAQAYDPVAFGVTPSNTLDAAWAAFTIALRPASTTFISGSVAVTLGALTLAASGTVQVVGSSASTLGALTSSAAGTVRVAGSLAVTLDDATLSAAGGSTSSVSGSLAATLADLTLSSSGTVRVAGSLTATLGALSSTATGTVRVAGTLAVTLDAVTSSATGTVRVAGSLAATLAAATAVSTGTVRVAGSLAATLAALSGTSAGTVRVAGSLSATLGSLTVSAAGTVPLVVTYVGGAQTTTAGSMSLTSLTGGLASAPAAGDLVIVAVMSSDSSNQDISVSGYEEVADLYANDSIDTNLGVFYKVMPETPDTTVTIPSGLSGLRAAVYVLRNVNGGVVLDVSAVTSTAINGGTPNPPQITTATANTRIVIVSGTTAAGDYTPPTNYGNAINVSDDLLLASRLLADATTEDPGSWPGISDTSDIPSTASVTMAIRVGGGPIAGSVTATLGALASAGTGTVRVQGQLAVTLAAVSLSQIGERVGVLSSMLMPLTLVGEVRKPGGKITVYLEGEWITKPVFYWTGSQWRQAPLFHWNGTNWKTSAGD
jgi:hypothetical protein